MSVIGGTRIVAPVSIQDVKTVLGSSSNDLGTLCTHPNINKWSYYKPMHSAVLGQMTEQDIRLANDGFSFKEYTDLSTLWGDLVNDNVYAHNKPRGGLQSPYRLADFENYNHNAKEWIGVSVRWSTNDVFTVTLWGRDKNNARVNISDTLSNLSWWRGEFSVSRNHYAAGLLLMKNNGQSAAIIPLCDAQDIGSETVFTYTNNGTLSSGEYYCAMVLYPLGGAAISRNALKSSGTTWPESMFCVSSGQLYINYFTRADQIIEYKKHMDIYGGGEVFKEGEGGGFYTFGCRDGNITVTNENDAILQIKVRQGVVWGNLDASYSAWVWGTVGANSSITLGVEVVYGYGRPTSGGSPRGILQFEIVSIVR